MLSDCFCPTNQAQCDEANTLREYEAAHKVWMNTSIFTLAGQEAKSRLAIAREKYLAAVRAAHPNWSV